jgi:hypothetical protein
MPVQLMDPVARFERIQQQLTQLLMEDSRLRETYAGFGIAEDPLERKTRIVALSQIPSDPGEFKKLLGSIEGAEFRGSRPPDFGLIETGAIRAASRPASGGDGIQLHNGPTGTLGCMVVDSEGNELFLSCNHVIADSNQAPLAHPIDEPIYSGKSFAGLHDYEPFQFGGTSVNLMDAAVGKPYQAGDLRPGSRSGGGFLQPPDLNPALNTAVEKEGDETGHTAGVLLIKNLSILVSFSAGTALFDQQYGVVGAPNGFWGSIAQPRFAKDGDSGSIVVTNSRVIGLLFAVSSRVDMAFVNPIHSILNRFGVTIA